MNEPVKSEAVAEFEELLHEYNAAVENLRSSLSGANAWVAGYDTPANIEEALRNGATLRMERRVQVEDLTELSMKLSIKIAEGAVVEYHKYLEALLEYRKAN